MAHAHSDLYAISAQSHETCMVCELPVHMAYSCNIVLKYLMYCDFWFADLRFWHHWNLLAETFGDHPPPQSLRGSNLLAYRHAVGLIFELTDHFLVRLINEMPRGWMLKVAHVVESPVGFHVLAEVISPNVIAQRCKGRAPSSTN
eukprot:SAG11_NODE_8048_length_1065_cov_1.213251_1_plen_145_part_00